MTNGLLASHKLKGRENPIVNADGVKRLSLPTFFAAAKKVGAAPHRGNACAARR